MAKSELTGVDEVIKELEKKLGKLTSDVVIEETINFASKPILKDIEDSLPSAGTKRTKYWANTGRYKRGFVLSRPRKIDGELYMSIGQKKGNKRGPLTHLLEYGSIKNPRPRQAGTLQRAMTQNRKLYIQRVTQYLRGKLK